MYAKSGGGHGRHHAYKLARPDKYACSFYGEQEAWQVSHSQPGLYLEHTTRLRFNITGRSGGGGGVLCMQACQQRRHIEFR